MKYLIFLIALALQSCHSGGKQDLRTVTESEYFDAIKTNDIKLGPPEKGEWLYEHKEQGQTFAQYKNEEIIRITPERFIIYLMPLGEFNRLQTKLLESTREYLSIFFQQKVVLEDPVSDSLIPGSARRTRENGNVQLLAPYILDSILRNKIPVKAVTLLAITEKDLFPSQDWNYVFGLASYAERIGVSSVFRFQGKKLDSSNYQTCLARLINVCSHEIGHMFSLNHCIYAKCVMNGANSLYETDLSPNRLCSECQQKLSWNFHYNNVKRLEELNDYFKRNKLERDFNLSSKDLIILTK
jgi:archaemetzincin